MTHSISTKNPPGGVGDQRGATRILLDDLDKELERRGLRFARYADDALIRVKSTRAGERAVASLKRYLVDELRLSANEKRSRVTPDSNRLLHCLVRPIYLFNNTRNPIGFRCTCIEVKSCMKAAVH